jgi:hypothetical protein
MWKAQRQPMVDAKIPPNVKPIAKPSGCPPPIAANAILRRLPGMNVLVMMLTADGRHIDVAIPPSPRNRMSCVPLVDKPHASVNALCRALPIRYMLALPTTSATDPKTRRVQPHVKLKIEAGHKTRLWGMPISRAMVGIAVVMTPARRLPKRAQISVIPY